MMLLTLNESDSETRGLIAPFSRLVRVRTSVGQGGRRYAVTLSNGSIRKNK
jgi:hypothetical protein